MEETMEQKILSFERINRIGFDRVRFKNIRVINYDLKHLIQMNHSDPSVKGVVFKDSKLMKIQIESQGLGRVKIIRVYPNYCSDFLAVYLDFSPTDVLGQNIENFDLEEVKFWTFTIFEGIKKKYRIHIDYSNITFNEVEINFNAFVDIDINSLEQGFKQILQNIPYMNTYAEFKNAKDKDNSQPRSLAVENNQQKIVIYDKTNEARNKKGKKKKSEIEKPLVVDENGEIIEGNILRIEIKFKNTKKINSVLSTARILDLNKNAMFEKLYVYLSKNIFNSYEKSKHTRIAIIKKIVVKYKNMNNSGKRWFETMIAEILLEERLKGIQILLDKEELLETVKTVLIDDQNKNRKYASMIKILNTTPYSMIKNEQTNIINKIIEELKSQFLPFTM